MPKSTRQFLFPDINVWVALTSDQHVHHVAAQRWFAALRPAARPFFCRFTQLGLLRLLTTEVVMGREDVLTQEEAWRVYDAWFQDERIAFLEESAELETDFRAITRSRRAAPKDWADSYLAAFARSAQLQLVTFDKAFLSRTNRLIMLIG